MSSSVASSEVSSSSSSEPGSGDPLWTYCVKEGELCQFEGVQLVRFGAEGEFIEMEFEDEVECVRSIFGDPLRGVEKYCELMVGYVASSSSAPSSSSSMDVSSSTSSSDISSSSASSEANVSSSSTSSSSTGASSSSSTVGIYVAIGDLGRTTISCDGGHSWIFDQSSDDDAVCFSGGLSCDHHELAGKGVVFVDNAIFASYGWGNPGSVQKSLDGVNWDVVNSGANSLARPAYGENILMIGRPRPLVSFDKGDTWITLDSSAAELNVRETYYIPGKFVLFNSNGNGSDARLYYIDPAILDDDPQPADWYQPSSLPEACFKSFWRGGLAYGNGITVIGGARTGTICYSEDGGDTFAPVDLGSMLSTVPVWDGSRFWAWSGSNAMTSVDGKNWDTTQIIAPSGFSFDYVTHGDFGFVGVRSRAGNYYENQQFVRSDDGITWEELSPGSFKGGHPIRSLVYGEIAKSNSMCPD